jgi:hypothetical protein
MVYFITDGQNVKIGKTNDIDKRIGTLQTGNEKQLQLLYIIEDVPDSFETHVHGVCERYRLSGEWFHFDALAHLQRHPWFQENMIIIRPKK